MANRRQSFLKGKLAKRHASVRKTKPQVVVFCEGEKTEPLYFDGVKRLIKNLMFDVHVLGAQGVPKTLVTKALARKNELTRNAAKSRDSFERNFQVWAIFDVDSHPELEKAKLLAKQNGIKVGCSNPCFEIWLLYHVEDCHKPYHRHELQKYLGTKLKSYDSKSGKNVDFAEIELGIADAVKRARNGIAERSNEGIPEGNPSSSVVELIEFLLDTK